MCPRSTIGERPPKRVKGIELLSTQLLELGTLQLFVALLRHRSGWAGGYLLRTSRLQFEVVGKLLKPGKPVVVVKDPISLAKGRPCLVAW